MLRGATLTIGTGARTAHNIPWSSTEDPFIDRILASAPNARRRKTTKTAQHRRFSVTVTTEQHVFDTFLFINDELRAISFLRLLP